MTNESITQWKVHSPRAPCFSQNSFTFRQSCHLHFYFPRTELSQLSLGLDEALNSFTRPVISGGPGGNPSSTQQSELCHFWEGR